MKQSRFTVLILALTVALIGCNNQFQAKLEKARRAIVDGEVVGVDNTSRITSLSCKSSLKIDPMDLNRKEGFETNHITGYFEAFETPQFLEISLFEQQVQYVTMPIYNGIESSLVKIQGQCLTKSCTEYLIIIEGDRLSDACKDEVVQLAIYKSENQTSYVATFVGPALDFEQIKSEVVP